MLNTKLNHTPNMDFKTMLLRDESIEEIINKSKIASGAEAMLHMLNGENIFLSGGAGSGKTTLIRNFIKIKRILTPQKNIVTTSTTGISALLIDGITIHKYIGQGYDDLDILEKLHNRRLPKSTLERIRNYDILIIDEVSMLSDKMLKDIYILVSAVRGLHDFQIIVSGDFTQLKPVDRKNIVKLCYGTNTWNNFKFKDIYLDRNYRARDKKLNDLLFKISTNQATFLDLQGFKFIDENEDTDAIKIVSTKKKALEINATKQKENYNRAFLIEAELPQTRDSYSIDYIKKSNQFLQQSGVDKKISIKVNDRIMITKNETLVTNFAESLTSNAPKLSNGMIGDVIDIKQKGNNTEIMFNYTHPKTKEVFSYRIKEPIKYEQTITHKVKDKYGNVKIENETIAHFYQYPITLAYAITIHKSQGQTYDNVIVDLSNMWSENLGYVAISRATSVENLGILTDESNKNLPISYTINPRALKVSDESVEIKKSVIKNSNLGNFDQRYKYIVDNIAIFEDKFNNSDTIKDLNSIKHYATKALAIDRLLND